jgi:hypothetical protein
MKDGGWQTVHAVSPSSILHFNSQLLHFFVLFVFFVVKVFIEKCGDLGDNMLKKRPANSAS